MTNIDKNLKTVVITGGTKGIGRAIALDFKNNGYNVVITYNTSIALIDEFVELGIDCYKLDVRDSLNVTKVVEDIVNKYGIIDCLVNNSGISEFKLFTDITDNDLSNMLDVNLMGALRVTREVLKQIMINQKYGSIINISSIWGITGASMEVHYSASKAGLIGASKALAKELGLSNITVNVITPGVINTDMIKSLTDEDIEDLEKSIPLNKIGKPEDVSGLVVFLASDKARYITGQVISVDGGFAI